MSRFIAAEASITLSPQLTHWLESAADGLDTGTIDPSMLLPKLAVAGLAQVGVPREFGGSGGNVTDAIAAIAAVSERSLAAGLVLWGHRTYIEYLLQSPNAGLRQQMLPEVLEGRLAGATGLSNAMKFLSGLEELRIHAQHVGEEYTINGNLAWVTNLPLVGFNVAVAVARPNGKGAFIASVASEDEGVSRSPDLDLLALRSTNTAALTFSHTKVVEERIIHPDAEQWLPLVRPTFLGLQIGMSIGLARRALSEARNAAGTGRQILQKPIANLSDVLKQQEWELCQGLANGRFLRDPAQLFALRIDFADTVAEALALELHATGGAAYLSKSGKGFSRRWREAAFIPLITPTVVKLQTALAGGERDVVPATRR
jgi:alkylation response protein AidB-like acyl-CoA dehydrogenase